MKKILALLFLFSSSAWAGSAHKAMHHAHDGHQHKQAVNGESLAVDPKRFDKFIVGLAPAKLAVVSVQGMVCDFCARGIEKTFSTDPHVKKIDVDLDKGKVLIAYARGKKIDFAEIKQKILANGQNATALRLIDI